MATEVKKVKFVYFDYVHPKAFHLTSYKQNLFFDLCQLYWKITWDYSYDYIWRNQNLKKKKKKSNIALNDI